MDIYSVLFVCTGNICRSPTAEGVFRHYVEQNDLSGRLHYDSAGTHGYHVGEPPDHRAVQTAEQKGVRMHDLRARKIAASDFEEFDLILAMDEGHYDILSRLAPANAKADIALFMDYVPQAGRKDVPDPYYGGQEDFDYVLDLVEQGSSGLLDHLKQKIGL